MGSSISVTRLVPPLLLLMRAPCFFTCLQLHRRVKNQSFLDGLLWMDYVPGWDFDREKDNIMVRRN